ncbi:hypothetical protein KIPB_016864, partial [Kipferlia bialata]
QYGAVPRLLTLVGAEDVVTQEAAARALQNIRRHHIAAVEAWTRQQRRTKGKTAVRYI